MDTRELRNCLGHFATGVTVVTYQTENGPQGITVNSFTSVSLDPPLILISIDRKTNSVNFLKNNSFTVNILKDTQEDIAMHFAGRPLENPPFQWEQGGSSPRFIDSLAYLECSPWKEYDGGDHVLYLGEVKDFSFKQGNPLTFYRGQFGQVTP